MMQIRGKKKNTLKAAAVFLSLLLAMCTALPLYVAAGPPPQPEIAFASGLQAPLALDWDTLLAQARATFADPATAAEQAICAAMTQCAEQAMMADAGAAYYAEGTEHMTRPPELLNVTLDRGGFSVNSLNPAQMQETYTVTYSARHEGSGMQKALTRTVTLTKPAAQPQPAPAPSPAPAPPPPPVAAGPKIVFTGTETPLRLDWTALRDRAQAQEPAPAGDALYEKMEELALQQMQERVGAQAFPEGEGGAAVTLTPALLNADEFSLHPVSGRVEYTMSFQAEYTAPGGEVSRQTDELKVTVANKPGRATRTPPAPPAEPYKVYWHYALSTHVVKAELLGSYQRLQDAVDMIVDDTAAGTRGACGDESYYEIVVEADDPDVTRVTELPGFASKDGSTNIPVTMASPGNKVLRIRMVAGEQCKQDGYTESKDFENPRVLTHVNPAVKEGEDPAPCIDLRGHVVLSLQNIRITKEEGSLGDGISAGLYKTSVEESNGYTVDVIMGAGAQIANIGQGVGVALRGGRVYLTMYGGSLIHNCDNTVDPRHPGGGVYLRDTNGGNISDRASGLIMTDNRTKPSPPMIQENCAPESGGGGVYVEGEQTAVALEAGFIWYNKTDGPGGGLMLVGSDLLMIDSVSNLQGIRYNTSTQSNGGGIYCRGGRVMIQGGAVVGNHADNGAGGGVYAESGTRGGKPVPGVVDICSGTIEKNTAQMGGGVAVGKYSEFTMRQLVQKPPIPPLAPGIIRDNVAALRGGGVFVAYSDDPARPTTFTMRGGTITGNIAKYKEGEAPPFSEGRAGEGDGGGIFAELAPNQTDFGAAPYAISSKPALFHPHITIQEPARVEGNFSRYTYMPPDNADAFTNRSRTPLPGGMLNNDDINFLRPLKTVTYYANNGGAGTQTETRCGTLPTGEKETLIVEPLQDVGFTVPHRHEFIAWATEVNGGGDTYQNPPEQVEITGNLVLFAQWKAPTVILDISAYTAAEIGGPDYTKPFTYTLRVLDAAGKPLTGRKFRFTTQMANVNEPNGPGMTPANPGTSIDGNEVLPLPKEGEITLNDKGEATFTLVGAQSIDFKGIPLHASVQVTQTQQKGAEGYITWNFWSAHEGITPTPEGPNRSQRLEGKGLTTHDSGKLELWAMENTGSWDKPWKLDVLYMHFSNVKKMPPPTGAPAGETSAAVGLGMAGLLPALGAGVLGAARRKKRGRA